MIRVEEENFTPAIESAAGAVGVELSDGDSVARPVSARVGGGREVEGKIFVAIGGRAQIRNGDERPGVDGAAEVDGDGAEFVYTDLEWLDRGDVGPVGPRIGGVEEPVGSEEPAGGGGEELEELRLGGGWEREKEKREEGE